MPTAVADRRSAFARAYHRLVEAWKRHQDVRRNPENVTEIASRRAELDDARAEVAAVRPEPRSTRRRGVVVKADVSDDDRRRVAAQTFPSH